MNYTSNTPPGTISPVRQHAILAEYAPPGFQVGTLRVQATEITSGLLELAGHYRPERFCYYEVRCVRDPLGRLTLHRLPIPGARNFEIPLGPSSRIRVTLTPLEDVAPPTPLEVPKWRARAKYATDREVFTAARLLADAYLGAHGRNLLSDYELTEEEMPRNPGE